MGGGAWQAMTWSAGIWTAAAGTFPVAGSLRAAGHRPALGPSCRHGRRKRLHDEGGNKCKGDLLDVQRVFSGSLDRSGSIRAIGISEGSGVLPSSYALPPGDHELTVDVGTTYFHTAQDPTTDETVALRVASSSGSKNFAIDCDSGTNFRDEIAYGCYTPFGLNTDYPGCPRTTPNVPVDCVDVETGDKVGQLKQGMNDSLHRSSYGRLLPQQLGDVPQSPHERPSHRAADPDRLRRVHRLGRLGHWTRSPCRRFASFYVTGWDGDSCASNEPYPFAGSEKGNIWGHFIIHIAPPKFGRGDPETRCQFNTEFDIDTCIAVLTR